MNVLWLQSAGCGGCTMSLLCAEGPNVFDLLAGAGIRFLWHPALSLETGGEVQAILAAVEAGTVPLDVLCIEGSIATGPRAMARSAAARTAPASVPWEKPSARMPYSARVRASSVSVPP